MIARPRRRRIEVYFILYLVALVLLLPDSPQRTTSVATVPTDLSLDLQPERVRLECQLIRDSAGGLRLRNLDSVNVIRYSGDVENIQVVARIEDVLTGQILTLEPGNSATSLFQLVPQPDRQAVLFRWSPDLTGGMPRTLRVTVTGTAMPPATGGPNASDADLLPQGLRISGSTQFVLATTIVDESGAPSRPYQLFVDTLRVIERDGRSLGNFWVVASKDVVSAAPLQPWSVRLSMGGADPLRDLDGMPQVRTTVPGVDIERFLDTAARSVVLRGRAPRTGSYVVMVNARRRDGEVAEASFVVQSISLPAVNVPDVMYPGVEYSFDAHVPDVASAQALIMNGNVEVASTRSGKLTWMPRPSDTGKVYYFVRHIDGQQTEAPRPISIRSFPPPEIRDVKDIGSGDKKKVVVKFFGDRNQDRPILEVLEGNARTPRKLFGNQHAANPNESPKVSWIEEFEISRRDPSKPFVFVIQARDPRGRVSGIWVEK